MHQHLSQVNGSSDHYILLVDVCVVAEKKLGDLLGSFINDHYPGTVYSQQTVAVDDEQHRYMG